MKLIGIDYGRKKIGIAQSEGVLAEPLKVVRVNGFENAVKKIRKLLEEIKPDRIVVGVSEGKMGEESKEFARKFNCEIYDETLSTYNAQKLSREANVGRKKRKDFEDAYAASVMLQSYLDRYV